MAANDVKSSGLHVVSLRALAGRQLCKLGSCSTPAPLAGPGRTGQAVRCHLPGIPPSDRAATGAKNKERRTLRRVFLSSRSPELCLVVVDTLSHPCLSLFLHLMHPLCCFSCICLLGSVHSPGYRVQSQHTEQKSF